MSLRTGDIDRAWEKLGMEIRDTKDRHALFFHEGRLILKTFRSFGSGKIEGTLPSRFRQQLRLNESQFDDLIACPLDREGYVAILRSKGVIGS